MSTAKGGCYKYLLSLLLLLLFFLLLSLLLLLQLLSLKHAVVKLVISPLAGFAPAG